VHVVLVGWHEGLRLLIGTHLVDHRLLLQELLLSWDNLLLVVLELVHLVHYELLVLLQSLHHGRLRMGIELLLWLALELLLRLLLWDEGWLVHLLVLIAVPEVGIVIHSTELGLFCVLWLEVGLRRRLDLVRALKEVLPV
jgi:hypothetical protein